MNDQSDLSRMVDKIIPPADMPAVQIIEIDPEFAGQRVDNYLLRFLKGVPKSRIYRIVRKGEVRVNGKRVKPDTRLQAADKLRVPPVRISDRETQRNYGLENILDKTIIYESKLMLIINKPAGVAVHGGSGISSGVIESLRQLRPNEKHLELVHRLDKGTSGCLMIAKKRAYLKLLQAELHRKTRLKKLYQVVTHGKWPGRRQKVEAPLIKLTLPGGERICRVNQQGKDCLTQYQLVANNDECSLLNAIPVTGRTHQIRVHCQYSGFPVVGDEKYGFEKADKNLRHRGYKRMMLHAARLEIPALEGHPAVTVDADAGEQMQALISEIKR